MLKIKHLDRALAWDQRQQEIANRQDAARASTMTTTPQAQPDTSTEREAFLPIWKIDLIAQDAQVAFCLDKFISFELAFAYGIEASVRAALAAQAAPSQWQPIETAPQHGTILLWWTNAGAVTGGFAIDEDWTQKSKTPREGWKGDGDVCIPRNQDDCTHWQLLRAPTGCKWPRFSDGHSTQEWLEQRAAPQPPKDQP